MTNVDIRSQSEQSTVKIQRKSRLDKDCADMDKVEKFFSERFLFDPCVVHGCLMNIATGLKAPEDCSAHCALDLGQKILDMMVGQNPLTVKIPKTMLAKQIPTKSVVKNPTSLVDNLDPQLFFQRALKLTTSGELTVTLEDCLKYELNTKALSLFDVNGFMRSNAKSDLAAYLIPDKSIIQFTDVLSGSYRQIVLDGGALIHRVGWSKDQTFAIIIEGYKAFIRNMFGD